MAYQRVSTTDADADAVAADEQLGAISGLWTSEDMNLIDIKIDVPLLEKLLRRLGDLGYAEFLDIRDAGQKAEDVRRKELEYKDKLRVCESIERRFRYFEELFPRFAPRHQRGQDAAAEVAAELAHGSAPPLGVPAFAKNIHWQNQADALDNLGRVTQDEERGLRDTQIAGIDENVGSYCALLEQIAVLECMKEGLLLESTLRPRVDATPRVEAEARRTWSPTGPASVHAMKAPGDIVLPGGRSALVGCLVGCIPADKVGVFRRLASRASRGSAVVVTSDSVDRSADRGPMDIELQHQACAAAACMRERGDPVPPSFGDAQREGWDMLRELREEGRYDDPVVAFRIVYSSYVVQQRMHKLCQAWARVYFASPIPPDGGLGLDRAPSVEELCRGLQVERVPASDRGSLELAIRAKRAAAVEKITMTRRLTSSVARDLARIKAHHGDRRRFVLKEKAVYHATGMMRLRSAAGAGELKVEARAWVPRRKKAVVEAAIRDVLREGSGVSVDVTPPSFAKGPQPPTWYDTNVVTATFQGIVDSYGVPRYGEVNPAIWTIITFPWLFGIMYGDIGHGLMIAIIAGLLIIFEKEILRMGSLNEIVEMVFSARYLIVLMGLFATYMGFVYNDTFGIMLEYSPSRYRFPDWWEHMHHEDPKYSEPLGTNTSEFQAYWNGNVPPICSGCGVGEYQVREIPAFNYTGQPYDPPLQALSCPYSLEQAQGAKTDYVCYTPPGWGRDGRPAMMTPAQGPTPFGVDVAWSETENKLDFLNSFKMKNAIIIGVLQMTFGLFLSLCNYINRRDWKHALFGFIPEFVFLTCTFGYMAVMICIKWMSEWPSTHIAPNTLETMTNFFLSPGYYPEFDEAKCHGPENDCSGYELLFGGQENVQVVLLALAFAILPFMLFPIPCIERCRKQRLEASPDAEEVAEGRGIEMQEVWIKQVIHVIEYVLGAVSNTASYLRLWALSLAHAQLSEVFFEYAFLTFLHEAKEPAIGGIMMYLGFGAWLSVTFGVLIVMEALSAFLHALRLHWVEFQNKFYVGDGRAFSPLSFRQVFDDAGAAEPEEAAPSPRSSTRASGSLSPNERQVGDPPQRVPHPAAVVPTPGFAA